MPKMKPGKYAGHKFTADQEQARTIWRRASNSLIELHDALHIIPTRTREELHARLDERLDAIERARQRARDLFAEVDESFTVATMNIRL